MQSRAMIQTFVLTVAIAAFAVDGARSNNQQAIKLEELTGLWEGAKQTSQIGDCKFIGTIGKRPTSVMGGRVLIESSRFRLTVESSGAFSIQELFANGPSSETRWTGQIASDLSLTAVRAQTANCHGQNIPVEGQYIGKLKYRRGQSIIKLKGVEEPCPGDHCAFQTEISIKRVSDGSEKTGRDEKQ